MSPGEAERIGELLIEEGVVTQEEMTRAIAEGGIKGTALAAVLESSPHVRRAELAAFLSSDFRVPAIDDLRKVEFPEGTAQLVPEEVCRKHEVVPVARIGDILCVAKFNYYNRAAVQDLHRATRLKIKVLQADEAQVRAAIERLYKGKREDLPAPAHASKPETPWVRAASPAAEEVASFDAVPLISPPEDNGGRSPSPKAALVPVPALLSASRGEEFDEVIEIMDAIRIAPQEFASALRDPFARLVVEFDEVFQGGRAVTPLRIS